MISKKCSGSSKKKRRMEDRDVSDFEDHSIQLGTLPQCGQCEKVNTLSAILTSALPGGDHPNTDPASQDRRLLPPPALGQDCARAPYDRYLPSAADDIARTTDCLPPSCRPPTWTSDCSTPSCRSPSRCLAWGGGHTWEYGRRYCLCALASARPPLPVWSHAGHTQLSLVCRHYTQGSGLEN